MKSPAITINIEELLSLGDPLLLPAAPALPHTSRHLPEAYRQYIRSCLFAQKQLGRATFGIGSAIKLDSYWNKKCLEEALRRGDMVPAGKRRFRLVLGSLMPKTPQEIRTKLQEIESAIEEGASAVDVCFLHGVTVQQLGAWRRQENARKEIEFLKQEVTKLKEKLLSPDPKSQSPSPEAADLQS